MVRPTPSPTRFATAAAILALLLGACSDTAVPESGVLTDGSPATEAQLPGSTEPSPSTPPPSESTSDGTLTTLLGDLIGNRDGGVAVLMVRDGATSLAAAGDANNLGDPLLPETPMRVGSISKPFIATMVLQLMDEGRVDLDVALSTYVPGTTVGGDVTVRALLGHRSGIFNYTDVPSFFADVLADRTQRFEPATVLEYVAERSVNTGGQFAYSNTNYILLGQLIEALEGTDINTALQTRIAEPLGLTATSFDVAGGTNPPDMAAGWSNGVVTGDPSEPYVSIASSAWTAGALISSTADLATFLSALFDGRLISADALAQMTATEPDGYGLGLFAVSLNPGSPGYGHNGAIPGFSSTMAIDPASGDILVILTNNDTLNADTLAPQILRRG